MNSFDSKLSQKWCLNQNEAILQGGLTEKIEPLML